MSLSFIDETSDGYYKEEGLVEKQLKREYAICKVCVGILSVGR